jgi:crotonobetainyl-CoA:carnitine CoA-transferase CaiB-like acyl-CoA transferase
MRVGEVVHPERADYGKPLDGVRILALEQQQSLPFATMLLARLGAEVIRVEHPGRGETGRDTFPAMKDPQGRSTGATFLRNNLNKKGIAIDLKSARGRELILKLAPRFDIVVENFRGGTLDRLKLGYQDIAKVHPKVIYASVSGFGAGETPYAAWSAFAPVVEAMAGHYEFKRRPDSPPQVAPTGVAVGDTGTGLFAAVGILAALRHRDRKGIGQHVDVAMYDCAVALADVALNYWSLGVKSGNDSPSIVTGFRAKDGYFVMMCSRRKQFEPLARIVGHPEWITDPRFPGPVEWAKYVETVFRPGIEAWAASYTKLEACEILNGAGIAVAPSQSMGEILADPHIKARNMVVEMPRSDGVSEPVMMPGNPIKLSKMSEGPDTRVPWLGEHTDEVLGAELGLGKAELTALRSEGVIA